MSPHNNHHTLVALDDVLGALAERGPLSSEELARRLGLTRLDARMVLVDAHAHGLVGTNNRGQWEISDDGRDALMAGAAQGLSDKNRLAAGQANRWALLAARFQRPRPSWPPRLRPRHLGRGSVALALGMLVSAGGVAVANSGLPSFSSPPVITATHSKPRAHGRRKHIVYRTRPGVVHSLGRIHRDLAPVTLRPPVRRGSPQLPYVKRRLPVPACRPGYAVTRAAGRRPRRSGKQAKRSTAAGTRTDTSVATAVLCRRSAETK